MILRVLIDTKLCFSLSFNFPEVKLKKLGSHVDVTYANYFAKIAYSFSDVRRHRRRTELIGFDALGDSLEALKTGRIGP